MGVSETTFDTGLFRVVSGDCWPPILPLSLADQSGGAVRGRSLHGSIGQLTEMEI